MVRLTEAGARAERVLLIEKGSGPAAAKVESATERTRKRCMGVCGRDFWSKALMKCVGGANVEVVA